MQNMIILPFLTEIYAINCFQLKNLLYFMRKLLIFTLFQ
ncbi:MAG: hypothetical protein IGBAC_0048 [Ignavibacteriae bacterium]|nr:MAG: hypothetical protein IGBAC_0048 [Ignavibacteriota bacterium]